MKIDGGDVLGFLRPNGGWVIYGDNFDSIIYNDGVEPVTKEEFEAGFEQAALIKEQAKTAAIAKKAAAEAKLAALGLTSDDLKALGL